jgi:hypothetical protein
MKKLILLLILFITFTQSASMLKNGETLSDDDKSGILDNMEYYSKPQDTYTPSIDQQELIDSQFGGKVWFTTKKRGLEAALWLRGSIEWLFKIPKMMFYVDPTAKGGVRVIKQYSPYSEGYERLKLRTKDYETASKTYYKITRDAPTALETVAGIGGSIAGNPLVLILLIIVFKKLPTFLYFFNPNKHKK